MALQAGTGAGCVSVCHSHMLTCCLEQADPGIAGTSRPPITPYPPAAQRQTGVSGTALH